MPTWRVIRVRRAEVDQVKNPVRGAHVVHYDEIVRENLERDPDEAQDHQHYAGHVGHDPVAAHRRGERIRTHRPASSISSRERAERRPAGPAG